MASQEGDSAAAADLIAVRKARLEENKKRLEAIGLHTDAEELQRAAAAAVPSPSPAARRHRPWPARPLHRRESGRNKSMSVNYSESDVDAFFGTESWSRARRGGRSGSQPTPLDEDAARQARLDAGVDPDYFSGASDSGHSSGHSSDDSQAVLDSLSQTPGRKRGTQDSGKGVRVVSGKVYDSKFGTTCHWCRQKTLAETVTCTAPACGARRLPVSFCKGCLLNRHGEDWEEVRHGGAWVCPPCRGSCGPGCASCCNCGPCRKKLGMNPTGQVKSKAKRDGFANVHDWLVFQVTGESAEAIAARKHSAPWGATATGSGERAASKRQRPDEALAQSVEVDAPEGKKRRVDCGEEDGADPHNVRPASATGDAPPTPAGKMVDSALAVQPSPQLVEKGAAALQPRQLVFSSQDVDAVARVDAASQAHTASRAPAGHVVSGAAVEEMAGRVTEEEFAAFVESF